MTATAALPRCQGRSRHRHGRTIGRGQRQGSARRAPAPAHGPRPACLRWRLWVLLEDVSELRRLQQIRTEFIDNLSHELRTPLTTISLLAETLAARRAIAGNAIPARMRERIDTMGIETGHLATMVDELLDLSRIESGGSLVLLDDVDLVGLARTSIERLRLFADRQGVRLEVVDDGAVPDPGRREPARAGPRQPAPQRDQIQPGRRLVTVTVRRDGERGPHHRRRPRYRHPSGRTGPRLRALLQGRPGALTGRRRRDRPGSGHRPAHRRAARQDGLGHLGRRLSVRSSPSRIPIATEAGLRVERHTSGRSAWAHRGDWRHAPENSARGLPRCTRQRPPATDSNSMSARAPTACPVVCHERDPGARPGDAPNRLTSSRRGGPRPGYGVPTLADRSSPWPVARRSSTSNARRPRPGVRRDRVRRSGPASGAGRRLLVRPEISNGWRARRPLAALAQHNNPRRFDRCLGRRLRLSRCLRGWRALDRHSIGLATAAGLEVAGLDRASPPDIRPAGPLGVGRPASRARARRSGAWTVDRDAPAPGPAQPTYPRP